MRFLMIGISIVIGIILVGVVFSVTTDLIQPREVEKVVSFELEGSGTTGKFIPFSVFGELITIINNNDIYVSFIDINNGTSRDEIFLSTDLSSVMIEFDLGGSLQLNDDESWKSFDLTFNDGDLIKLYITVEEAQITSTSAILIALVPILFATGVILYAYNTSLRGREE